MITFKRTVLNGSWPLVREFGFRNAGNCCLGRGISPLESGKQVEKSGMPITIGIQIPSSTKKAWSPVPGIQESTARNPESKTVLDSITWERGLLTHYEKNLYPVSNVAQQSLPVSTRKQVQILTKISVSLECIKETFCFHIRIPQSREGKVYSLFLTFLRVGDRSWGRTTFSRNMLKRRHVDYKPVFQKLQGLRV